MLKKLKKGKKLWKIDIFPLRWYPNSRSCVNTGGNKVKPEQMPPLMVRKAAWRR